MGSLGPGAARALNQELQGWKSLNGDLESVGCVASHVAETGRGWFLNFSGCNQELPSKGQTFAINICKSCGEGIAYSYLVCDDISTPAPWFCCGCVFCRAGLCVRVAAVASPYRMLAVENAPALHMQRHLSC